MFVELSNFWIIVANIIAIPLAHLSIAWCSLQLPQTWFDTQKPPSKSSVSFYQKYIFIHKWKHLLPDAAPWLGGFAKATISNRNPSYLKTFICECRRGQLSHWVQFFTICCFVLWNPWPASGVIILYALLSNIPCIINLHYTEIRLISLLSKKRSAATQ